jgi:nucleotide-binding universal stress UspA family protein
MTYKTIMVHLQLGQSNAGLLRIADELADRFQAKLVGVAVCQPMRLIYNEGYVPAGLVEDDRRHLEQQLQAAEAEFRTMLQSRGGDLDWRSTITLNPMPDYLAGVARGADLVIVGIDHAASSFDGSLSGTGELVMQLGRPLLVVPAMLGRLKLERMVIAWTDSRESRRAAFDALPLLKRAAHVAIVELAKEDDLPAARSHLRDVVAWLRRHGVEAEPIAATSTGEVSDQLIAIAKDQDADVIVAGAYGHSRLREWALGGVTRKLLLSRAQCSLLSH